MPSYPKEQTVRARATSKVGILATDLMAKKRSGSGDLVWSSRTLRIAGGEIEQKSKFM